MRCAAALSVLSLAVMQLTCNQAILTAPPGSTITLIANPEFIPTNGGVSTISALVIDATGNPVGDGTVVQFFTSLGQIAEQGRTNDGVARVNLVSDTRSGEALVQAFSGGGSSGSTSGSSGSSGSSGTTSSSVKVLIGNKAASRIFLSASPLRMLPPVRSSEIVATVFDVNGNTLANVPVFFRVAPSASDTDFNTVGLDELDDLLRFTDNNGNARTTLRTRSVPGDPQHIIGVLARVPTLTDEVAVMVVVN